MSGVGGWWTCREHASHQISAIAFSTLPTALPTAPTIRWKKSKATSTASRTRQETSDSSRREVLAISCHKGSSVSPRWSPRWSRWSRRCMLHTLCCTFPRGHTLILTMMEMVGPWLQVEKQCVQYCLQRLFSHTLTGVGTAPYTWGYESDSC